MIAASSKFVQYLYVKDILLSMKVVNPKHNLRKCIQFSLKNIHSLRIQNRIFSMEQNISNWGCGKTIK